MTEDYAGGIVTRNESSFVLKIFGWHSDCVHEEAYDCVRLYFGCLEHYYCCRTVTRKANCTRYKFSIFVWHYWALSFQVTDDMRDKSIDRQRAGGSFGKRKVEQ